MHLKETFRSWIIILLVHFFCDLLLQYSCWEDRRKDEYFEVKTKSASGGDGLVTIVDKEEFAKFIEQSKTYEKPESEDENEEEGEGGDNSEDEEEGEEDNSDEEES